MSTETIKIGEANQKYTLFAHGPAAGPARGHGEFDSVENATDFIKKFNLGLDPALYEPFEEGASLYLVSADDTEIWALTEEAIEEGYIDFYNATNEDWAQEQIDKMRMDLYLERPQEERIKEHEDAQQELRKRADVTADVLGVDRDVIQVNDDPSEALWWVTLGARNEEELRNILIFAKEQGIISCLK